jgi:hypothetical protein
LKVFVADLGSRCPAEQQWGGKPAAKDRESERLGRGAYESWYESWYESFSPEVALRSLEQIYN